MTHSGRLLIVDDDADVRRMLVRTLARRGFETSESTRGQEAVARVDEEPDAFDVVLLDMRMPGMSGLEVVKAIRERYSQAALPIIMLTACDDSELVVELLEAGANDYITKPFDVRVLVSRVNGQLKRRRQEQEHERREQEHERRVERWELISRGNAEGMWSWDIESDTVYYSERFKTFLGCRSDKAWNHLDDWLGRVHREDRDRVRQTITEHTGTDKFRIEHRVKAEAGGYLWVVTQGAVARDEFGKVTRVAGSLLPVERGASHDAGTGLPTRELFVKHVDYGLGMAETSFAVLLVEVDQVDMVAQSYGPRAADEFMRQLGSRLSLALRPSEGNTTLTEGGGAFVARLSLGQLAVMCEQMQTAEDAGEVAKLVGDFLHQPVRLEGDEVRATTRIGVALAVGCEEADALLRDAHSALERARLPGSPGYAISDPQAHERVKRRLQLESRLVRALERQELRLVYQPIMGVDPDGPLTVESLMRWDHTEEPIGPAEFIPVAEDTGLIVDIGEWALEKACRDVHQYALETGTPVRVGVNISAIEVESKGWTKRVAAALERSGLPPHLLTLELTERVFFGTDHMRQTLEEVAKLGVRLAIDDFGTGYSSLAYLKDLPIHSLKIDRSFIKGLPESRKDLAIARSIIALAHNLELVVVAEGVETEEQASLLKAEGCNYLQGWHYGRPGPLKNLQDEA